MSRATAASKFDGKIQAFLEEYLSSDGPGGPVFGGRDAELEVLDNWLQDPAAPPRFLLTAPAGRGKSALLVHWIYRIQQQLGDAAWSLLFVPISIRFRTNRPEVFFEAIAARLAEIVRVELQPPSSDPSAWFEDQCRVLLDHAIELKKRVLIVLDGIDEALGDRFGTTWIPRALGTGLRILVSARIQAGDRDWKGWADRLGWRGGTRVQTRNLPPLPMEGVADLLVMAGLHGPDITPELSARLHVLTDGEPLVLKLLVEDMQQRVVEGKALGDFDMTAIKPGLAGFFEDWFERQREIWRSERRGGEEIDETVVSAFLAVLACACGPLMADDLIAITGHLHPISITFRTEDALRPLRRFVIGTGRGSSAGSGFVLSHPRLAEFLREEYFDGARIEQTRAAFADWGADLLRRLDARTLLPARVPAYALEYLAHHFEEQGMGPAGFLPLMDEPWMRAWEALEGGYRGFARDVAHVRRVIERHAPSGEPCFAWQLRCMLILSSISSSGANIPPVLLVRCVAENVLPIRQALHWAEYQSPRDRLRTLAGLAHYVTEDERSALLNRALDTAGAIALDANFAMNLQPLGDLVSMLPDPIVRRVFDLVVRQWSYPRHDDPFGPLLKLVAEELPAADLRRACRTLLSSASDQGWYFGLEEIVAAVGPALTENLIVRVVAEIEELQGAGIDSLRLLTALSISIQTGHHLIPFRWAIDRLDDVWDDGSRGDLIARLATVLPRDFAAEVLERVLRFERRDYRVTTLSKLADFLGPQLLKQAVYSLAPADVGAEPFVEVARQLPDPERAPVLLSAVETIGLSNATRARIIFGAWDCLPEAFLRAQITWAMSLAEGSSRAQVLASIAARCPDAATAEIHIRIIEACQSIPDAWKRCEIVRTIASRGIANGELIELALDAVAAQSADWACAESLTGLAPYLDGAQAGRALQIILAMKEPSRRIEALSAIASRLPATMLDKILQQALPIAGEEHLDELLAAIASLLQPEQLEAALDVAGKIPERDRLMTTLACLTPHLPKSLLPQALSLARGIGDERERAILLCRLAALLREDADNLLQDALTCLEHVRVERDRAAALVALGPSLPRDVCARTLASLQMFRDLPSRCAIVASMAAVLGATECGDHLEGAVNEAILMDDEQKRAQALLPLLPHLRGEMHARALDASYQAIRRTSLADGRVRMLAILLDHAKKCDPIDLSLLGRGTDDDEGEGSATSRRLSADEILAVAMDSWMRIQAYPDSVCEFAPMFHHLARDQIEKFHPNLVTDLVAAIRRSPASVHALLESATVLSAEEQEAVLQDAFRTLVPTGTPQEWALEPFIVLATQLPSAMRREVLSASLRLSVARSRPQLLRLLESVLTAISGEEGICGLREIARAVRETAKWFH